MGRARQRWSVLCISEVNDTRTFCFKRSTLREYGDPNMLVFFHPLTFVTSVFGMTHMPTTQHYWVCYERHVL